MRINTLKYTLKEGFKGLFRNKWYTLASIATISACLFLLGIFIAILMNFQHIVENVQKGVAVTTFFVEGTTEEEILTMQKQLEGREEVDRVVYISAEQAWADFVEDMNMGEYMDGFPENPLAKSANLEIYINDASKQADLVSYLESSSIVRRINKSELAANTLSGIDSLVGVASIGIIGILFLVSVFLISNTVTIGISIRKEEINIMKYIGATDFFVRFPFIIEGILIGLIGAALPLALIYVLYNQVILGIAGQFPSLTSLLGFLDVTAVFEYLVPVSLGIGVGIGFFGSFFTCKKHLKV
ncbi:MAG: permease-like cell division protein FtsX [Lachnospiraceae bacterium]|nr:permease-like cell division protein FtsX [Lachnospiraceae bacterium]MBR4058217.1 permease-like cell division protein FtsX [Lachnospiraceae bacterium]